jgi:2-(1,2-epoxy-1,2-dihydrophenyl)acetyl-CoA isomerase
VDQLLARAEHGVLTLTLNDPPTRNALGPELARALLAAVAAFAREPDQRCLVLTGAAPAFCSGADVRSFQARIDAGGPEPAADSPWLALDPVFTAHLAGAERYGPEIIRALVGLPKPVIAAVNGPAYGLGCGLTLACDFRVAAESATFCEAFVRNGLVPADGSTWLLPRLVGDANAKWLQYTGEAVDAAEALRIGLVGAVVADDELLATATAMARRLAAGPGPAIGLIKQLVLRGHQQDLLGNLALASRAQDLARATADHRDRVAAFLARRAPHDQSR